MSEKTNQANFTARLPRGAAVRRLADMQLIVYDLIICKDLFTLIDKQPIQGYVLEREALLWSLLVKLVSCFTDNKGREHLIPLKVFGKTGHLIEDFKFFKAIRDRNVAHHENSMNLVQVVALVGTEPDHPVKDLNFLQLLTSLDFPKDIPRLKTVVHTAFEYAEKERWARVRFLMKELSALTPDQRDALQHAEGANIQLREPHIGR